MAEHYKGGAAGGRKPRSKGGATSDRKSRSNGGTAGDRKPRSASDAGCCVCVRSDLEAVELILLVDGHPDSCVVMAPAQAVELARQLWVASLRVDQRGSLNLDGADSSWP